MGKADAKAIEIARDFKEKIEKKYDIQKIIVFGSRVTGGRRKGSDIDLLIVAEKIEDRPNFMSKLLTEWHINQKKKIPVDFICFTRKEFEKLSKRITIVKQALEEGVEI